MPVGLSSVCIGDWAVTEGNRGGNGPSLSKLTPILTEEGEEVCWSGTRFIHPARYSLV